MVSDNNGPVIPVDPAIAPHADNDAAARIGHALKPLGEVGRGLFMDWSFQSEKFDAKDAADKWDSFKPTKTGYQAVFKIAQEMGWVNPRKRALPNTTPADGVALFDAPALNVADVRDGTTATRPLTELGNAQRLADLHGDGVRYVPETKGWLYWHDGASWRWDTSGAGVRELAAQLSQYIYSDGARFDMIQAQHFAKWARKSQTVQVIGNSVSLLSNQNRIRLSLALIDANSWLVGFDHARQVIDLRTGRRRSY